MYISYIGISIIICVIIYEIVRRIFIFVYYFNKITIFLHSYVLKILNLDFIIEFI